MAWRGEAKHSNGGALHSKAKQGDGEAMLCDGDVIHCYAEHGDGNAIQSIARYNLKGDCDGNEENG